MVSVVGFLSSGECVSFVCKSVCLCISVKLVFILFLFSTRGRALAAAARGRWCRFAALLSSLLKTELNSL